MRPVGILSCADGAGASIRESQVVKKSPFITSTRQTQTYTCSQTPRIPQLGSCEMHTKKRHDLIQTLSMLRLPSLPFLSKNAIEDGIYAMYQRFYTEHQITQPRIAVVFFRTSAARPHSSIGCFRYVFRRKKSLMTI